MVEGRCRDFSAVPTWWTGGGGVAQVRDIERLEVAARAGSRSRRGRDERNERESEVRVEKKSECGPEINADRLSISFSIGENRKKTAKFCSNNVDKIFARYLARHPRLCARELWRGVCLAISPISRRSILPPLPLCKIDPPAPKIRLALLPCTHAAPRHRDCNCRRR
jgi:hypothetical protein